MNYFNDYDNRPVSTPELLSNVTCVEIAGYIPLPKRIEKLIQAGQRLDEINKSQYDFRNDEFLESLPPDVTRAPGYDVLEAHYDYSRMAQATSQAVAKRPDADISSNSIETPKPMDAPPSETIK